jgi:hypothetical protein
VQSVFPPDRTVIHNFTAAPYHFREPLSKFVEKTYTPRERWMGSCTKKLHGGQRKIFRRANSFFILFLLFLECLQKIRDRFGHSFAKLEA